MNMVRSVAGGLLGGLALYMVGFVFWGTPLSALAFSHAGDEASATVQAALAQGLNATGTGVYIVPDPSTAQGTILFGRGPIAQIFYNSGGFPVTDSSALIGGLVLALLVGVAIAMALRFAIADMGGRLRVTILFSLAAVLWLHVGQAVFNHAPWGYTLYSAFSDFIGLVAAGAVAARLMGRDPVATTVTTP